MTGGTRADDARLSRSYLLRIPKGWNPEHQLAKSDPIIFIHGLGFGLLSVSLPVPILFFAQVVEAEGTRTLQPENMLVIRKLCKTLSSHPILIPLQPQISQQFWDPRHLQPTPRKQFVGDLLEACKRWNFYNERGIVTPMRQDFDGDINSDASERLDHLDGTRKNGGVVLLSHSNGSVAHTWMLKDVPGLTKRNALVDPVVFCSWEGGKLCSAHSNRYAISRGLISSAFLCKICVTISAIDQPDL